MRIDVISKLIVGYNFNDLCVVDQEKQTVSFCSPGLEEAVEKGFDNGIIDINEINPEFIALIMDLDFIEANDGSCGVIGKIVVEMDIIKTIYLRDCYIFEAARREVSQKVEDFDPAITDLLTIKMAMIEEVKIED